MPMQIVRNVQKMNSCFIKLNVDLQRVYTKEGGEGGGGGGKKTNGIGKKKKNKKKLFPCGLGISFLIKKKF